LIALAPNLPCEKRQLINHSTKYASRAAASAPGTAASIQGLIAHLPLIFVLVALLTVTVGLTLGGCAGRQEAASSEAAKPEGLFDSTPILGMGEKRLMI
jgi:hypothetical protein